VYCSFFVSGVKEEITSKGVKYYIKNAFNNITYIGGITISLSLSLSQPNPPLPSSLFRIVPLDHYLFISVLPHDDVVISIPVISLHTPLVGVVHVHVLYIVPVILMPPVRPRVYTFRLYI